MRSLIKRGLFDSDSESRECELTIMDKQTQDKPKVLPIIGSFFSDISCFIEYDLAPPTPTRVSRLGTNEIP